MFGRLIVLMFILISMFWPGVIANDLTEFMILVSIWLFILMALIFFVFFILPLIVSAIEWILRGKVDIAEDVFDYIWFGSKGE